MAEDALKNRDLRGAAKFYETGIASDPTWAQGWYNAALVYAELNEYSDAADFMKHYVVLMPDAPDVQPAKDNIILWEAKTPHAAAPASRWTNFPAFWMCTAAAAASRWEPLPSSRWACCCWPPWCWPRASGCSSADHPAATG